MYFKSLFLPFLSFAVRYCQADGGIMITGHNTKEYNGFKAYNKDVQLIPEEAMEVSEIARSSGRC